MPGRFDRLRREEVLPAPTLAQTVAVRPAVYIEALRPRVFAPVTTTTGFRCRPPAGRRIGNR